MPARVTGRDSYNLYAQKLRDVPKKSRPKVRKAIVDATKDIRAEQTRLASWSRRIPGAIGVRVGFATAKAELRVNARKAPHARPHEGPGKAFRHPVGGNRENWVSQPTRPFFNPPILRKMRELRARIEKAIIESLPR